MTRKIISFMMVCLLLLSAALPVAALEEPDLTRTGSIRVEMTYQEKPVAGGSLTAYRVAGIHEENGADYSFRLTEEYDTCQVELSNLADAAIAPALQDFIEENNIEGIKMTIDQEGKVLFADLQLGLYLLIQEDPAKGYYPVNPFLVSVPTYQDGTYLYEVDGSPKLALEIDPTPPPPPPPPDLPQTGLQQWPVPLLAIGGTALIVWADAFGSPEGRRKMKRKMGIVLVAAGFVLLCGALGLQLHNRHIQNRAEKSAAAVMPQLVESIYDRKHDAGENETATVPQIYKTQMPAAEIDGETYVGFVGIESLGLELPVTEDWSYKKLLKTPCRFSGDMYTDDLVVMAHNYDRHFGSLKELSPGDAVTFTDMDGTTVDYRVVAVDILERTDVEEMIAGEYDLTLFTCTYGGKSRVTVRCDKVWG